MLAGRTNYKFQIELFPRAYLAFTYKSSMCEATRNVIRRSDLESAHVCVLSHVDKWPNVAPNVATRLFNDGRRRPPPSQSLLPSCFRRRSISVTEYMHKITRKSATSVRIARQKLLEIFRTYGVSMFESCKQIFWKFFSRYFCSKFQMKRIIFDRIYLQYFKGLFMQLFEISFFLLYASSSNKFSFKEKNIKLLLYKRTEE